MTRIRPVLRQVAYRSGLLSVLRTRVRQALTVVMFHCVMDPADPDYRFADPVYTVSAPLFETLLGFFRDHYTVVDIQRVIAAHDGIRALPDHALLITFDDGWADNLRCAAPLLRAYDMPAVILAAAEAVNSGAQAWWQEEIYAAGRSGRLGTWLAQIRNREAVTGAPSAGIGDDTVAMVTRLAMLANEVRASLMADLPRQPCHARMMLTADELRLLGEFGIAVGLHGHRHVPLTSLTDVVGELANARETLGALMGEAAVTTALGCPHGRYDDRVIAAARAAGISLVFTSDKVLNTTDHGMLTHARPLGRISFAAAYIEAAPHRLDPAAVARWLWSRESR